MRVLHISVNKLSSCSYDCLIFPQIRSWLVLLHGGLVEWGACVLFLWPSTPCRTAGLRPNFYVNAFKLSWLRVIIHAHHFLLCLYLQKHQGLITGENTFKMLEARLSQAAGTLLLNIVHLLTSCSVKEITRRDQRIGFRL